MTPKQVAIDLVNKYGKIIGTMNKKYQIIYDLSKAKKCALLDVENSLRFIMPSQGVEFYSIVKQEIEKL